MLFEVNTPVLNAISAVVGSNKELRVLSKLHAVVIKKKLKLSQVNTQNHKTVKSHSSAYSDTRMQIKIALLHSSSTCGSR